MPNDEPNEDTEFTSYAAMIDETQRQDQQSRSTTEPPSEAADDATIGSVQSPSGTIDPTGDAPADASLPLDRRHVILGALAAFGLGAMGSGQADHNSSNQGLGQSDLEVKTGILSHDSPGAAEDGTWNTFEVDRQSVEFEEPFDAPPVVFIGSTSYTSIGLFRAIDVTEDGFESRWMVYRSTSFAAPDAQWIAVGQA